MRSAVVCALALCPLASCGAGSNHDARAPQGSGASIEVLAAGPSEPAQTSARTSAPPVAARGSTAVAVEAAVGALEGRLAQEDEPPPPLLECLLDRPVFRSFAAMLLVTELEKELGGEPYTIFVPNDRAFQLLSLERRLELFEIGDPDLMVDVVRRHVVRGLFSAEDVAKAGELTTLAGTRIRIDEIGGVPVVDGAQLLGSRDTDEGMMHEIDRVLLP